MNRFGIKPAQPVLVAGLDRLSAKGFWTSSWESSLAQAQLIPVAQWSRSTSATPHLRGVRGIVTDFVGDELLELLETAESEGLPTLVVHALPGTTTELMSLATMTRTIPVISGLHLRMHPAFTRIVEAVQSAEIGLLRAVAADLVVASDSQLIPQRELLAQLLDLIRQLTGSAEIHVQAHHSAAQQDYGESVAFVGQTDRDVVVSAHVAQVSGSKDALAVHVNRIRVVGTHGWVLVDLLSPKLTITGPTGTHDATIGNSATVNLARAFASVLEGSPGGPSLHDSASLSRAVDVIIDSAHKTCERAMNW